MLRPLSDLEVYYIETELCIQTTSLIEGNLPAAILQRALNEIARRHPFLSARISKKEGRFYFEKNHDFEVPFRFFDRGDAHKIAKEDLNEPMEIERHLFRALFIAQKGVLITQIQHAVGDGISSMQLHKEILEACSELLAGRFKAEEPLAWMPPLEHFLSPSVTSLELSEYVVNHAEFAGGLKAKMISPKASGGEIEFIQRTMSKEKLDSLIRYCKKNQMTVHGAICSAHLLAVRELLGGSKGEIQLCCHSAVDFRSRLNPPIDRRHMFSAAWSWTGCYLLGPNESLATLGKKVSDSIKQVIENKEVIKKSLSYEKLKSAPKIPTAYYVTNVGEIKIPSQYGGIVLKEIYMIPSCRVPILVVSTTTFQGQLFLNYPYLSSCYSTEVIEQIAAFAQQVLSLSLAK